VRGIGGNAPAQRGRRRLTGADAAALGVGVVVEDVVDAELEPRQLWRAK
jgi:hypothetical protein